MSLASAMQTTNVPVNLQGGLISNQPFRPGGGGRNADFNNRSKPPQCFVCDGWHFARECPLIAKAKAQIDYPTTAAPAPVPSELTSVLSQLKDVFADISSVAKELRKAPEQPPPPPPPAPVDLTLPDPTFSEPSMAWSHLAATTKQLKEDAATTQAAMAKITSKFSDLSKVVQSHEADLLSANASVSSLADAVSKLQQTTMDMQNEVKRVEAKAARSTTALQRDVNGILAGKPTRTKVRTPRAATDPADAPAVAAVARGRATALGRRQRSPPARYRGEGDTETAAPAHELVGYSYG